MHDAVNDCAMPGLNKLPIALPVLPMLAGCAADHPQSALHPAGPPAAAIAWLWWLMFSVLTAVFVAVVVLTLVAIAIHPRGKPTEPPLGNRFIVLWGIIAPALILVALLFFSLETSVALHRPETALTIRVVGHQWWWEVHYPQHAITTANEIYIPAGEPVRLELETFDVIHSFWVPNLSGKMDMIPGQTNQFWIQADVAGTFRGQCAEFCGVQHAWMAFEVVALPANQFNDWVLEQQKPRAEPATPELVRGEEVFFDRGCHNCHVVRGTTAKGVIGPDLTHLGSRRTIGAGLLPNNRGNLAGWVSNPQALKPGNKMPRTHIESQDFLALLDFLESLK